MKRTITYTNEKNGKSIEIETTNEGMMIVTVNKNETYQYDLYDSMPVTVDELIMLFLF